METIKISSKYQIIIPKYVREKMGLKVGETLQVIPYEGRIELVPIQPIKKLKGFLKGIKTDIRRNCNEVNQKAVEKSAEYRQKKAEKFIKNQATL